MHQDRDVRRAITKRSFEAFFGYYFAEYLEYESAPFHTQMFKLCEDDKTKLIVVKGFRESAKSTIMAQAYPIWAAVSGRAQEIVLFSKNQMLSRHLLKNVRDELEENELLINDFRPYDFTEDQSGAYAVTLKRYHSEIIAVSREQGIRGIRHRQHRPGLIIIDDADDLASVKTQESRDDTWNWLMRDITPLGSKKTKMVILGSPLHDDSMIMRLSRAVNDNIMKGTVLHIPIVDDAGKPSWPAKFPTPADIEEARAKMDELAWQREMLLKIVPENGQLISREDIHFYDEQPSRAGSESGFFERVGSVDFALKDKQSADFTAMVDGDIYGYGPERVIYIQPNPLNKKLEPHQAMQEVVSRCQPSFSKYPNKVVVEDVGASIVFIDQLKQAHIPVQTFQLKSQDKRERFAIAASWIKTGRVKFPRRGCERLIEQMVGFGTERFDDLLDAMVQLVIYVMENNQGKQLGFVVLDVDLGPGPDDGGLLPPGYHHTPLVRPRSYGFRSNSDLNDLLSGAASRFLNR
jgi:phage terminase large subunit-like protein